MNRTPSKRRSPVQPPVRTPAPASAPAAGPGTPAPAPRRPERPRRRWLLSLVLPVSVVSGGILGAVYGTLKTPQYSATSYVIVVPEGMTDPATALGFAQTYGRTATQMAVLGDAPVWAGVPVRTLRDSVRAEASPDAPMIALTATSTRPDKAADIANAVSRALTVNANQTHRDTHIRVVPFSRAVPPGEPASPPTPVTALVGACAGGLLGGLVLLVRPRPRIRHSAASVPGPATAADLRGNR